jgi:hypothetical protein
MLYYAGRAQVHACGLPFGKGLLKLPLSSQRLNRRGDAVLCDQIVCIAAIPRSSEFDRAAVVCVAASFDRKGRGTRLDLEHRSLCVCEQCRAESLQDAHWTIGASAS